MSRHSKWSKIKNKKGAADKAKAFSFTKLLKAVTLAAQNGGLDPEMNFSLRLAVEKAKEGNVPKDNIERAIKRGVEGDKDGTLFEEALYEAFGPGGVAMLISCVTDNKTRTVSEVKNILSKNGGSMAGQGSVQWQFALKGVVRVSKEKLDQIKNWPEAQLVLMDRGADDILESDDGVEVRSSVGHLRQLLGVFEAAGVEPDDSGLEWAPKETVELGDEDMSNIEMLLDALDDNNDVQQIYTNVG